MSDEPKSGNDSDPDPVNIPMQERLKKAYIDKYNSLMVGEMTHEQIKYHIADLENDIKILNTQIQATMDVDEEWSRALTASERETLREKDKIHRNAARPAMNADGTIKMPTKQAKPVVIGDSGTKAFENLVDKLVAAGKTREQAVQLIKSMQGSK